MIYDLILDGDSRNLNHVFKVLHIENSVVYFCCTFDVGFLVFEKKQDRQVKEFVPRTRRIQGLDKQVDYGPNEHLSKKWCQNRASKGHPQQSYQFGDWIWDHSKQPLQDLQCKSLLKHTSNVFNLLSCVADELDLRSNPFKGGGDGVILERPDEEVKLPIPDEEQRLPMELELDKEDVDYKEKVTGHDDLDQMEPAQGKLDQTAHEEEEKNPAQVKEFSNLWNGPITRTRAEIQRKPILQVAWAWLRRKRKKPRRLKQLGLFNCCKFCK